MNKEQNQPYPEGEEYFPQRPPVLDGVRRVFGMVSWIPFIFSAALAFILAIVVQVLFYMITSPQLPITYGGVGQILLFSLAFALIAGFFAKFNAERKMKRNFPGGRIF